MDTTEKYKALRAEGMSESAAVKALVKAGVDFDEAVDAAWKSAGQKDPHRDDSMAVTKWYAGQDRKHQYHG